jgi:hypothetical protein
MSQVIFLNEMHTRFFLSSKPGPKGPRKSAMNRLNKGGAPGALDHSCIGVRGKSAPNSRPN